MNRIEQMIHDLCVNGVKRVKLGDYFTRIKGTPITAGIMKEIAKEDGDVRIFAGGKTIVNAFEKDIPNANITKVPAVLVQSRGVIDFVYYDKPFTFKNEMWAYTHSEPITLKYLYYYCKNNLEYFRTAAGGMGSMPQISLPITEMFEIPLPPLEVQAEIVKILDRFAVLTAELEAELEARRQQYEYYRTRLLSFDADADSDTVQWRALGEVAHFTYGYTDKAKDEGNARYIRITDIDCNGQLSVQGAKYISLTKESKEYLLQKGDIVMARTGATYGKTLYFDENYPAIYASFLIKITLEASILPKFYWHFAQSKLYWEQANKLVGGGAQPQFNTGAVSQILIPIPSLAEQERIVNILDKFDQLVNGVKNSIPELIDKVQKQYEFYRNKLLTFPEA